MKRRTFLQSSLCAAVGTPVLAALNQGNLNSAAKALADATASGQVRAASLFVQQNESSFARSFGAAKSIDAIFLLASISKTISSAAVMSLYDQGEFALDDRVTKFIPEFTGAGRETITIQQLLTHVSGLPDQLPQNAKLRAQHAPLSEFVNAAIHTPLLFTPGTKYSYSSMAILLATEIAQRISGMTIAKLTDEAIYRPLNMKHSAMGLGNFKLDSVMLNQVERAAPESGAGDPSTKSWDWNSPYWRKMGAPWGAAHGSAPDVAKFLNEFLHPTGKALKPETLQLMIKNHNPPGLRPRGLAFDLGPKTSSPKFRKHSFGHTGSTGTICWADTATKTICVVLTTLPSRAVSPHPRDIASDFVTG